MNGRWAIRALWLIAALPVCGCTTMVSVAPEEMHVVVDGLRAGDRVALLTATGWHERLQVVDVDGASIRTRERGEREVFARADVTAIRVRRAAPGRTAALAAGIYILGVSALCGNPLRSDGC